MTMQPQVIGQPDPSAFFDIDNEDAKIAYMKRLGARNMDPPLPHSSHLLLQSGAVVPWEEMLAEQRDLVKCCDEHGNTDPAAWEHTVIHETVDSQEQLAEFLKAQSENYRTSRAMTGDQQVRTIGTAKPFPVEYPEGIVPYGDSQNLPTASLLDLVTS